MKINSIRLLQAFDGGCEIVFGIDRQTAEHEQNAVRKACNGIIQGKLYEVTLKEVKQRRSLDANAYFHLLVDKIAKTLGQGVESVKKRLVLDYGVPTVTVLLPENTDVSKYWNYAMYIATADGKDEYILYKATHSMDTAEMSTLIKGTIEEAKQLGIQTETPFELAKMGVKI